MEPQKPNPYNLSLRTDKAQLCHKRGEYMENIIDKIVDIDRKALDIKAKTEKILQDNGKKLNEKLAEIEKKELENAKKVGEKKYRRLIKQGENERDEIKSHTKKECRKLEESYTKIHKKLEKEIFSVIFKDN